MTIEDILSRKILKLELSSWLLILMVVAYSTIFSYYTIMRHYSFRSNAWDLGIYVQSLSNAIKGRLFTNNVELYYSPTGSYFGIHFSPILFVVLPFFCVVPLVETILVIQSVVLALGAIPVYLLSKHHLKRTLPSLFLSASYLLNPLCQGVNWYDFHTQAFFPFLILSATYYLKKRRVVPFLFFTCLALSTMEQAIYLIAVYGLYCVWEVRHELKECLVYRRYSKNIFIPIVIFTAVLLWSITVYQIKSILNPNPPVELKAISNYRILGIKDPAEIPVKAVANLDLAMKAIQFDLPQKIFYILLNFASSAFLAFLSPMTLLPSFVWIFLSILSNWPPYYQLGFQYTAFTLPFISLATIDSIYTISTDGEDKEFKKTTMKMCTLVLIVDILLSMMMSPISPVHKPGSFSYFRDYGVSSPSSLDVKIRRILEMIPENSTVITTATIFPHISNYRNAYVIPPLNFPSQKLFKQHLRYLKSIRYDYIFLIYLWDKSEAELLYSEFVEKEGDTYGLYVRGAGLELYKRGYKGTPKNIPLKFSYKELFHGDSTVVYDPSSESGNVLMLKPYIPGRCGWYGPYITLTPGTYIVRFKIKTDIILGEDIIKLDVWSRGRTIASRIISGSDIAKPSMWHTFTIRFTINERIKDVEFRGMDAAEKATVWLDYVEVIPEA